MLNVVNYDELLNSQRIIQVGIKKLPTISVHGFVFRRETFMKTQCVSTTTSTKFQKHISIKSTTISKTFSK